MTKLSLIGNATLHGGAPAEAAPGTSIKSLLVEAP
jgi:hypothetical protein